MLDVQAEQTISGRGLNYGPESSECVASLFCFLLSMWYYLHAQGESLGMSLCPTGYILFQSIVGMAPLLSV